MIRAKFFVVSIALVSLFMFSCKDLVEPEQKKEIKKTDYELKINRINASIGDTVKIIGKKIGNVQSDITIYMDTISVNSYKVVDTCVSFVIPKSVPERTYFLSITIRGEKIEKFASISIVQKEQANYELHIDSSSVKLGDNLKLRGKNFGTAISGITFYLDETSVTPSNVNDTCVTVKIPDNIPIKSYDMSISINNKLMKNFGKISVIPKQDTTVKEFWLDQKKVEILDVVTIYGKGFLKASGNIIVYLEETPIKPIKTSDYSTTFVVPTGTKIGTNNVSIKILSNKTINFSQLEVVPAVWWKFLYGEIDAGLPCTYITKVKRNGYFIDSSYMKHAKMKTSISTLDQSLLKPQFLNGKMVFNFISSRENGYPPNSQSTSGEQIIYIFKGELDTISKKVTNIVFSDKSVHYSNSSSGVFTITESRSIEAAFGTYSDIENGIEIIIPYTDLEESIKKFEYSYSYEPYTELAYSHKLLPPYSDYDYVKIVLWRK